MTTKSNLEGLTVKQIKDQYSNGKYTSKMLRADVVKAALASEKKPETKRAAHNTER
jgi:hypothetical protein